MLLFWAFTKATWVLLGLSDMLSASCPDVACSWAHRLSQCQLLTEPTSFALFHGSPMVAQLCMAKYESPVIALFA